jgi:hypothetical protein
MSDNLVAIERIGIANTECLHTAIRIPVNTGIWAFLTCFLRSQTELLNVEKNLACVAGSLTKSLYYVIVYIQLIREPQVHVVAQSNWSIRIA